MGMSAPSSRVTRRGFLYKPAQNKSNDYGVDRVKQRFFNFSGMMNTPVQDFAVTENQRGPITDRTKEALCSSDQYLVHIRHRLMNAAKAVQQGERVQEAWNAEWYGMRMPRRVEVPAGTSVEEAVQRLLDPESSENVASATSQRPAAAPAG